MAGSRGAAPRTLDRQSNILLLNYEPSLFKMVEVAGLEPAMKNLLAKQAQSPLCHTPAKGFPRLRFQEFLPFTWCLQVDVMATPLPNLQTEHRIFRFLNAASYVEGGGQSLW